MRKTTLKEVIISATHHFGELSKQASSLAINRVREIHRELREMRERLEIKFNASASISSKPGNRTILRTTTKDIILPIAGILIGTGGVIGLFLKGVEFNSPTPIVSTPTADSLSISQKTEVKYSLQAGDRVSVTKNPTNFRSSDEVKNGKHGNLIGTLTPKDELTFLNFNQDRSWQFVRLERTNQKGWVNSENIRKN